MSSFASSPLAFAVLVVLALRAPAFAPPGIFFGVTVPAGFARTDAGRAVERSYRRHLAAYVALGLVGMLLGVARRLHAVEALASFVVVAGMAHGCAAAHRRALPFAVAPDGTCAAVIAPRVGPMNLVAWQLPAWCVIGAVAAWLANHRASGGAAVASSAAPLRPYVPLVTGALALSVILATGWLLTTRGRRGSSSDWATARVALIGSAYVVALSSSAAALAPVVGVTPVLGAAELSLPLLVLLVVAVLVAARRRGEAEVRGPSADGCWKWGLFYVNPSDPALLVPKRFGIGYTLNFARPGAWIFGGSIVLIVVTSIALGHG